MPVRGVRRGKIKRTKTFTGCSTCRSRGVKCGEEKPTCLRCKKMKLECEGYGITLVWPGSREPKASLRRVMLTGLESSITAMRDEEISSILGAIDSAVSCTDLTVGLFGVFPASISYSQYLNTKNASEAVSCIRTPLVPSADIVTSTNDPTAKILEQSDLGKEDSFLEIRHGDSIASLSTLRGRIGLNFLEPSLYDSMPIKSKEGRKLMNYWITHLSPLMIPTERLDNPFTSVIVPLAISASDDRRACLGQRALLHSVYALSAFSQSSCSTFPMSTREMQHALGSKCLQAAFEELGRSLVKGSHDPPEAVLVTILMLIIIGIFTDNYSNYRVHIRGGAEWIRSIDKSTWKHNGDASAIYQLFTGLEALRPAHSILAGDLGPQDFSLEYLSLDKHDERNIPSQDSHLMTRYDAPRMALSETGSYCLDKIFALTKPVLECIMQINRLIFSGVMPADGEFVSLEFKIMASNPELLHFPSLTPVSETVAHHHACTLWCALYIYYKSSVLIMPPIDMQWLVRQSIEHLDAIETLTEGLTCSGFLWPLFITGCEAVEEDLRSRVVRVFEKREKLGISNVAAARRVVAEVWRRRDDGATAVSWHDVMSQLGIDILLS